MAMDAIQNPATIRLIGGKAILCLRSVGMSHWSTMGKKTIIAMGSKFCIRSLGMP